MSGLIHERALNRWINIPTDTSQTEYQDGAPLSAGLAMILASNEAHLCQESCRQLMTCAPNFGFDNPSGKTPWDGVIDTSAPSAADIAALPMDEPYKRVSWVNFTLRWGPFFVIADRASSVDGSPVCRRIQGDFRFTNTHVGQAHFVLTTHRDPLRISQGDVVKTAEAALLASTTNIVPIDWSPDIGDGAPSLIQSRHGTASSGSSLFGFVPFYVWLSVESLGCTLVTASLWESR